MYFAVVLMFVAAASAAPSETLKYEFNDEVPVPELKASNVDEDAVNEETLINPLEEGNESDLSKRHKKSATTTFCVEVRPSDPYQKPYEICESGNHVYSMPADTGSDYKAPASVFGASMSSTASRPYSKPSYSAPKPSASFSSSNAASAFASSSKTEANYPKGNHYGSYRSGDMSNEEDELELDDVGIMMNNGNEEMGDMHPMMRSAGYGYGSSYDYGNGLGYGNGNGYGNGYGYDNGYGFDGGPYHGGIDHAFGGMSYIKAKGYSGNNKKSKAKGHSHGLIITCHPNLAGYTSPIGAEAISPIGYGGMADGHYGPGGHMAYRSSSGKLPKYRSKYYGHDSSGPEGPGAYGFGGSKSDSGLAKPAYGGNSLQYNDASYYTPSGYNRGSPAHSSSSSSYSPGPIYPSSVSHIPYRDTHYSPPTPNYPAPSIYANPQGPVQPAYGGPAPLYNIPQAPSNHGLYNGYNPASASVPSGYSASSVSSSDSYVPQGAYRSSESTANSPMMKGPMEMKEKEMERTVAAMARQDEKEKHTMESMNKMSHSRPSGMWNNNMRSSGGQGEMKLEDELKPEHSNGNSMTMTDNQQAKS